MMLQDYIAEHSDREPVEYTPDLKMLNTVQYMILTSLSLHLQFHSPHLPENTHTFDEIGEIPINQVVIGSCTNGHIQDMRKLLKNYEGQKRLLTAFVRSSSLLHSRFLQAMEEGLIKTFIEFGAVVSTSTCGPCLGGYMGILAEGERCVSTTNRNFVGRMGHVKSEIYLASPAVAAASAVTAGKIITSHLSLDYNSRGANGKAKGYAIKNMVTM